MENFSMYVNLGRKKTGTSLKEALEKWKRENKNRDYILNKIENRLNEKYSREISAIFNATSFVDDVRKVNQELLQLEGLNLKLKGDLEFEDSEIEEDSSEESSFISDQTFEEDTENVSSEFESEASWEPERLEDIPEDIEDESAYVDENQNSLQCHICTKSFVSRANVKRHLETHKRRFKCNRCGDIFKTMLDLKVHRHVHAHEKPFKCDFCGVGFKAKGNLKEHRRIHTGEKHKCDICEKEFTHKSGLNSHKKIHTDDGSRPFECDKCDSKFRTASRLKSHALVHSTDRPYNCDNCFKKFKTANNLR